MERKIITKSKMGYIFEKQFTHDLNKTLNGREATMDEQLTMGIDYVVNDTYIQIKNQPQAHSYRTINLEIEEYSTANPNDRIPGCWTKTEAHLFAWHVGGNKTYWFKTDELKPYVDAILHKQVNRYSREARRLGAKISQSNGKGARHQSSKHGCSRYDNAVTIRMPITIIAELPSTTIQFTDQYGYTLSGYTK